MTERATVTSKAEDNRKERYGQRSCKMIASCNCPFHVVVYNPEAYTYDDKVIKRQKLMHACDINGTDILATATNMGRM